MSAPPLDAIVFFAGPLPPARMLAAGAPPRFEAYVLAAPFPALDRALADPEQPLTVDERLAAEAASSALHLRCSLDLPPSERLPALLDRLDVLFALGGVAAAMPAAQRVFGPSLLAASRADADGAAAWLDIFLHRHAVRDGDRAWLHTHGMEHFDLPDLECTVADRAPAEHIIDATVESAVLDGTLLRDGHAIEIAPGPEPAIRIALRRARDRPGHPWGVHGALELVFDRE